MTDKKRLFRKLLFYPLNYGAKFTCSLGNCHSLPNAGKYPLNPADRQAGLPAEGGYGTILFSSKIREFNFIYKTET